MLKGRACAVSESLSDVQTDTYEHLKTALFARFSLHRAEVRLLAREELNRRKFVEGRQRSLILFLYIRRVIKATLPITDQYL